MNKVENYEHGWNQFPRYGDIVASSEVNPLSVLGHLFNRHTILKYTH